VYHHLLECRCGCDTLEDNRNNNRNAIDQADVIVVGGGNTLFAMDRWTKLGIVQHLRRAMERGAILTGGSAGAICWFDGGHSDSMDPDTYKQPMLEKFGANNSQTTVDESSTLSDDKVIQEWKYIRVNGLGFLPGLVCPHHDRVQSNGVLRAHDFDQMLLRHPGELGIGIDHWAALVVEGERYRVLSLEGKGGSVQNGVDFCADADADGVPGIWIKEVKDGKVHARICPHEGTVEDLLRVTAEIIEDKGAVERCRRANPSG
jgi:dipeptidase E